MVYVTSPGVRSLPKAPKEVFADALLPGLCTALDTCRKMQRKGGTPTAWLELFCTQKNLLHNDRSYHELKVLVYAAEAAGSFDQLNVGSLISLEILLRRISSITKAHEKPVALPS